MFDDKAIDAQMQSTEEMSSDQMVKLLTGGAIEGETAGEPAEGDQTPEVAAEPEKVEEKPKTEAQPEVLAKDGKHTIPYEELETAREKAKYWEQVATENAALAESLQQAKEQDAGTGKTQAQDELIASLQRDFPEIAEAVQKMVDARVGEIERKMAETVAPLQKSAADAAVAGHFRAIADAHSDYEQVRDSPELAEWIEKQPSFLRDQCKSVLAQGTAPQVIELFTAFKDQQPKVVQTASTSPDDAARKAAEVIAAIKPKNPVSLSDIPAGSQTPHDEAAAMLEMSSQSLMGKFEGKTPDQIMELMSRVI